ncbi:MAG: DNA cytosine methyltransferase [bacterium]|nr:DNA cytosine methyltransferase [bacterium]
MVDFYCGAGGFTLGAALAGFEPIASFDWDSDLTSTFGHNFPSANLVLMDLARASFEEVLAAIPARHVTAVIGGPPCQGFSNIGLRDSDDPRNDHVTLFFELVAAVKPMFFVMENVPMVGHSKHSKFLNEALNRLPSCYEVLPFQILNAADFGAATNRTRLFIVGRNPGHVDPIMPDVCFPRAAPAWFSVRDAIVDIPEPFAASENDPLPYRNATTVSEYARKLRAAPPTGLGSTAARVRCDRNEVTGNSRTVHSSAVRSRFIRIEPGKSDPISRYPRLDWDRPAPVLRAGTGSDRGSFQAARPIHPDAPRVISVREAARLQGFPDWFEFASTKWHSHRMIGNSVPPPLAKSVLEMFRGSCA